MCVLYHSFTVSIKPLLEVVALTYGSEISVHSSPTLQLYYPICMMVAPSFPFLSLKPLSLAHIHMQYTKKQAKNYISKSSSPLEKRANLRDECRDTYSNCLQFSSGCLCFDVIAPKKLTSGDTTKSDLFPTATLSLSQIYETVPLTLILLAKVKVDLDYFDVKMQEI